MDIDIILENLSNPALLFFVLGLLAVGLKSDLEIPPTSSRFISIYLLFAIGFKGGQELAHSHLSIDIFAQIGFGILLAVVVPIGLFFILRLKLNVWDSGAVAAAYGSISAVTFLTAVSFLEIQGVTFGGHMVAMMALMEAPAIVIGIMLIHFFDKEGQTGSSLSKVVKHAFTNGSVLLILGSLVIGFLASEKQARGIEPFTTDIFKGFLAIFLLDMGIISGRKLKGFLQNSRFVLIFAMVVPLVIGSAVAILTKWVSPDPGDRFLFAVLAASASYIAVPATMKVAEPRANPGIYLPMALAVTFPVNITLGIPIYFELVRIFS